MFWLHKCITLRWQWPNELLSAGLEILVSKNIHFILETQQSLLNLKLKKKKYEEKSVQEQFSLLPALVSTVFERY